MGCPPFHLQLHRHARTQLTHLMGADAAGHLQLAQVHDGQQFLLGRDLFAGQRVALGDDAADGRHQGRLAQLDARRLDLGQGGVVLGLGAFQRGAGSPARSAR
jgi:hypothetical protein